ALNASPTAAPYFAERWEVALVDLPRVCGFQPNVFIDHAQERVRTVQPDALRSIAEVTLPLAAPSQLAPQFDQQRRAFVLNSANSNLRTVGAGVGMNPQGLPGAITLNFEVCVLTSYVQA